MTGAPLLYLARLPFSPSSQSVPLEIVTKAHCSTMRALTPRKRTAAMLQMARDAGKAQEALDAVRDGLYHHHWLARWRAIQVVSEICSSR